VQSFNELNLSAPVLRAVHELGFETPTPIQSQTLPILLGAPTDFLGLAATGTGKTAAYGIPLLERVDAKKKAVQSLILCPTRELALQVAGQINLLGKYKGVKTVAVYGGASYVDQIHGLRQGASVVVGTPGRVIDHINRGNLKLENLEVLVLDEADEMISMGFKDELEQILSSVPRDKSNIWLFSATMNRQVSRVAEAYLRAPQQVQVNRKEMLSSTIEQFYYPAKESDKPEILCKLIEAADEFYGLIFCQTKQLVSDLTQFMTEKGYRVDCLHGDKDQNSRERTMQAFRDRRVRILVCTDVASRGLDVKDITHVINYSLPRELDNYVHRIGRTARSGKTGIAMNLVTHSHRRLITQIENMTKSRMIEGRLPTRKDIGVKRVAKLLPSFTEQPFHTRALEVMSPEWREAIANMTPEEVASRFMTLMMPEVFVDKGPALHAAPPQNSHKVVPRSASAPAPVPRAEESRPQPQYTEKPRYEKKPYHAKFSDKAHTAKPHTAPKSQYGDKPQYPAKSPYAAKSHAKPHPVKITERFNKSSAHPAKPGSTKLGMTYPTKKRRIVTPHAKEFGGPRV
jgi:ATP-dependent RNA helicase DeaD